MEFSGKIELNETCAGRNGSISTVHTIHSPATVTVPILCSIESEEFSCGAVRIRSGDTKLIHTTHHRTTVVQDNLIEDKVNMSNTPFSSDNSLLATSTRPGSTSWFNSATQTFSSYKTTLIIVGIAIAMLAAAAVPAGRMLRKASGVNITNFNSNSAPSNNSNNVDGAIANMEAGQQYPALPEPAAAEQEEEEVPQEEEDEEVEIWKILKKPVHLRTPMERIAADNWARLHDPFQLHH